MQEIYDYLYSNSTLDVENRQIVYGICNRFGAIMLVHNSRKVVRKSNVKNNPDTVLRFPLTMIRRMINMPHPYITVFIMPETVVSLMYCHRLTQNLYHSCKKLVLEGLVTILFHDNKTELEEWQSAHSSDCHCCDRCQPSFEFALKNGDKLYLKGSRFPVRVSGNKHCIYISRRQYYANVKYQSAQQSQDELESIVGQL